jgi:hypothetical protein
VRSLGWDVQCTMTTILSFRLRTFQYVVHLTPSPKQKESSLLNVNILVHLKYWYYSIKAESVKLSEDPRKLQNRKCHSYSTEHISQNRDTFVQIRSGHDDMTRHPFKTCFKRSPTPRHPFRLLIAHRLPIPHRDSFVPHPHPLTHHRFQLRFPPCPLCS